MWSEPRTYSKRHSSRSRRASRVRLTELDSVEDSELSGVLFLGGEYVAADFLFVVLRVVAAKDAVDVAVVGHGDAAETR